MRLVLVIAALLGTLATHLGLAAEVAPMRWLALALGVAPEGYEDILFLHAALPRAAMAVMVGAALGLAGSLLQQVTLNQLVSPLTIGASSGAWLALIAAGILVPGVAARHGVWIAMAGAMVSTGAVLALVGPRGISGFGIVLAGMAMHILLGALATVLVLLNDERVRNVFIWGAGDLAQTGWGPTLSLAPQLGLGVLAAALCRRPLALLRLGPEVAAGRGLAVWPFVLVATLAALWLSAAAIAPVGIMGFVGLIAPSLARLAGARTPGAEAALSLVFGAAALLAADALALAAGLYSRDLVPTGAAAALIGAPALILLALRRGGNGGRGKAVRVGLARPVGVQTSKRALPVLCAAAVGLSGAALFLGPTAEGWQVAGPGDFALALRWPRVLAAIAAGAGMAVAGAILQRLLGNPLASPDVIGISSGASLALVAALVFTGTSIGEAGAPVAMLGGLGVLAVLLLLVERVRHAPMLIAVAGIALAATLDALLQFVLARGGEETYMVVTWLAGSTFRVTATQALALAVSVAALSGLALGLGRWLTLMSAGDAVAAGRGLPVAWARLALLALASVIAALVTSVVGPVAFVGLVAPHLAAFLGARKAAPQLAAALLVGICLFVAADWLGRSLLYPRQIPAGAIASILGGAYLAALLARRRVLAGL